MRNGEIFWLDWNKERLFVFEPDKNYLLVASIIEGIREGDDFPAVPVLRNRRFKNTFYLTGGHHRSIGHLIKRSPLKCRFIKDLVEDGRVRGSFEIERVNVAKSVTSKRGFDLTRETFPDYRIPSKRSIMEAFRWNKILKNQYVVPEMIESSFRD